MMGITLLVRASRMSCGGGPCEPIHDPGSIAATVRAGSQNRDRNGAGRPPVWEISWLVPEEKPEIFPVGSGSDQRNSTTEQDWAINWLFLLELSKSPNPSAS